MASQYPHEKQSSSRVLHAPPPAYDSHYQASSSNTFPPPRPLTPPEKSQTNLLYRREEKADYTSHPSSYSPAGYEAPFPPPSFNQAGPSTGSHTNHHYLSSPNLSRNISSAQSRGEHPTSPPLDPSNPSQSAPPSFHRPSPHDLPYTPFAPIALYSADTSLKQGFPRMAPESVAQPHPFTTHDIHEEDWLWFLSNVKGAAAAEGSDFTSIPGVMPVATHLASRFRLGRFVSMGIDAHTESKKSGPIAGAIDKWNKNFFHPRQLEVVLARGRICYSGSHDGLPPDMKHKDKHHSKDRHRRGHSDDDSSSSSDSSHHGRNSRRREKRAMRRERRSHKKEQRFDVASTTDNKWRLVVIHKHAGMV